MVRLQKHQLRAVANNQPVPPPLPRRRNLESEMQRALIRWWDQACVIYELPPEVLFSIPNGFNADAKRGSIMKLEGQRKGAPDLMLAVGSSRVYGLFIELKTPSGVLSKEQIKIFGLFKARGYKTAVCRTLEDAQNIITDYLK